MGYNEVTDKNDIIIIYPQLINSTFNPHGCYDWFNYEALAANTTSEPAMYGRIYTLIIIYVSFFCMYVKKRICNYISF